MFSCLFDSRRGQIHPKKQRILEFLKWNFNIYHHWSQLEFSLTSHLPTSAPTKQESGIWVLRDVVHILWMEREWWNTEHWVNKDENLMLFFVSSFWYCLLASQSPSGKRVLLISLAIIVFFSAGNSSLESSRVVFLRAKWLTVKENGSPENLSSLLVRRSREEESL
jgi:hypothetical protein